MDKIPTSEKYIPLSLFQNLKVNLIKTCKIEQPPDLSFLVALLAFASADTLSLFHKFLEIHETLSVKKIFVTNFLF